MAALALTVVACDPSHDNEGPDASVTSEELSNGLQITAKSDGNNNLTICTSPSRYIQVFDASDGTMLGQGTNVKVQVVPPAGERSFYVETQNWDGSVVKSAPKSITVSEFTDLPKIYSDIFGDGNGGYTTCTWTWDTEASDGVWGNGPFLETLVQVGGLYTLMRLTHKLREMTFLRMVWMVGSLWIWLKV